MFIYIGELCRYLLAQPPKGVDSAHKIRLAYGNGLKPNIWNTFQTRFNVSYIFVNEFIKTNISATDIIFSKI